MNLKQLPYLTLSQKESVLTITYKGFKKSNEYRKQNVAVVFKFNKKIVVMGLWRKRNMMRDFTSLELAVDWFRRIVAEDKELLQHNRERLK